mmetsp:Transcript_4877/g.14708  ORF Transcript_4877/g.14708 Transcript_4877/m.14708 type:complete len:189 (-) Transcript_4877:835-1401(-)
MHGAGGSALEGGAERHNDESSGGSPREQVGPAESPEASETPESSPQGSSAGVLLPEGGEGEEQEGEEQEGAAESEQAIEEILGTLQQQASGGPSSSTARHDPDAPSADWDVESVERMLRMKLDEFAQRLQRKTYPKREVLLAEMQKLLQISEVLLQHCEDLGRRVREAAELNRRLKDGTKFLQEQDDQ